MAHPHGPSLLGYRVMQRSPSVNSIDSSNELVAFTIKAGITVFIHSNDGCEWNREQSLTA
jgi:hypothetical protein